MSEKPKANMVKALRVLIGFNQTWVAKETGIERSTISRIESGKRQMTDGERQKLAEVLNCSAELLK